MGLKLDKKEKTGVKLDKTEQKPDKIRLKKLDYNWTKIKLKQD